MSKKNIFEGRLDAANQRGVALVMVLLAVLVLSTLAAAIVFTSRAETLSSYNYRITSQAEYAAWAGIQRAVNYFNSAAYVPVTSVNAPVNYEVSIYSNKPSNLYYSDDSGVECIAGCATLNSPVVLTTAAGSNYPIAGTITSFVNALDSQSIAAAAGQTGNFTVTAQLMDYHTVNNEFFPVINVQPFEVWKITSTGTWNSNVGAGAASPTVVIEGVISPVYLPFYANAMFGSCSANISGSGCTDSFNSNSGIYDGPDPSDCVSTTTGTSNAVAHNAGVASNGGVTVSGVSAQVGGNVYFANSTGTACDTGYTGSPSNVTGGVSPAPAAPAAPILDMSGWGYPDTTDIYPAVSPTNNWRDDVYLNWAPPVAAACPVGTTGYIEHIRKAGPIISVDSYACLAGDGSGTTPYLLGDMVVDNAVVNLVGPLAGTPLTGALHVAIDSVSVTGGGGMINITNVAPGLADINDAPTLTANTALVLDIATSMTLEGQVISNVSAPGSPPPEFTVINIMGTGTALSMGGNAQLSALVNVPNGDAVVGGGGSNGAFYGSIMAQNVTTNGGVAIHYDVSLKTLSGTLSGAKILMSYTRPKF